MVLSLLRHVLSLLRHGTESVTSLLRHGAESVTSCTESVMSWY